MCVRVCVYVCDFVSIPPSRVIRVKVDHFEDCSFLHLSHHHSKEDDRGSAAVKVLRS